MFTFSDAPRGNVVEIRARGTLTQDDYDTLVPQLRAAIDEHDQIRALLEVEDLDGITPKALWDEITFDAGQLGRVERLAVVGDASWEKALEEITAPFVEADTRFFPRRRKDAARQWLQGSSE